MEPEVACRCCGSPALRRRAPVRYGIEATIGGQPAADLATQIGTVSLVDCRRCGYGWVTPALPPELILGLYRQDTHDLWSDPGRDLAWRAARIADHAQGRRILDVGCYTGELLGAFGTGWDRFGIEPIPWAAERASAGGVRLFPGLIEDTPVPAASMDAVTLMDVVEHLADPAAALRRVREFLRPEGVIAIETGDLASPAARILGADWWYVALPEHLSFFSPASLRRFLEEAGFEVLDTYRTWHACWGWRRTAERLAKAGAYRVASLAAAAWPATGARLLAPVLKRSPPGVFLRDHLFVVARRRD